jgi:WD40 repeat protein
MLQLLLVATLVGLMTALFTAAWRAGVPATVAQVCFSPNGKLLAARYSSGSVTVWTLDGGKPHFIARVFQQPVLPATGHQEFYESIFFLDDSRLIKLSDGLVSYSMSPVRIREFDVATRKQRDVMRTPINYTQEGFAGAAKNRLYLADYGNNGKAILCFDLEKAVFESEIATCSEAICNLALSRDASRIATIDQSGTVNVFDVASGEALRRWPGTPVSGVAGSWLPLLAIDAAGRHIVVRPSTAARAPAASILPASLFNVDDGSVQTLNIPSTSGIGQISVSDDGSVLAINHDSGVECYLTATCRRLCQMQYFQNGLDWIELAPDGKTLATFGRERIILWDVVTGRMLHELGGGSRVIQGLLFGVALGIWAAVWGMVRKRDRRALSNNEISELATDSSQRVSDPTSPLGMKVFWGLMVVGGLIALGIPIVLMFTVGPLLFPTIYFSLFVGLAAIARGAARDSVGLKRTAALQLANMIALDPANVVFAAMEFALLRSRGVRAYLGVENR